MKHLLIVLITFTLYSCAQTTSTTSPAFDTSGYEVNDKGDGVTHVFKKNSDGVILEEGYTYNGSKMGQWRTYNDDGRVLTSTNYINGKKYGKDITYNAAGNIKVSTTYTNDVLDGPLQKYEGRRVSEEVDYRNGEIDGFYKKYVQGKLQQTVEFKNGKQDGKMTYYDDQGDVTMEYIYKNGEKVGGGVVK